MAKQRVGPRIPPAAGDIQVNFCKNPACANFGVPASGARQPRGKGALEHAARDKYTLSSKGENPFLECQRCWEKLGIKSNLAIAEETKRFLDFLSPPLLRSSCPVPGCSNNSVNIGQNASAYHRYGRTAAGSLRYRCQACEKIFTLPGSNPAKSPIGRQTVHGHKNFEIFKKIVNCTPLNRIREMEEISYKTLEDHLRFLHRQCRAFCAERERQLPQMDLGERFLAVDRQDYLVNWSRTTDKRNVVLHGVGCADMETSYVFAIHLDFDPSLRPIDVEREAADLGDLKHPPAFRRFARLWLEGEYETKAARAPRVDNTNPKDGCGPVMQAIEATYRRTIAREDTEAGDSPRQERKLPKKGMQVHCEYTLYGHFRYLQHLLAGARKLVFFLDQESGIRAACHSAFWPQILAGEVEAFYVRVNKELTRHQKARLKKESDAELAAYIEGRPHLANVCRRDVRLLYLEEMIDDMVPLGPWRDRWLAYPFPNHNEPEKAVCWLTDRRDGGVSRQALAEMLEKATLHPIDRFFMQVRRRVRPLERSLFSASSAGRVWHAYAPYNPELVVWLLDLYRTFYNFIKVGEDGRTPAMRLGLARGPVAYKDVIYFRP